MRYRITHSTRYGYEETIPLSHNLVRMRPREHATQTCLHHQLLILPGATVRNEGFDYFGNHVTLVQPAGTTQASCESPPRREVQVNPSGPHEVTKGPSWEQVLQILAVAPDEETLAAREFTFESPHIPWSPELAEFARPSFVSEQPFLQCVFDLTQRIHRDFKFLAGSTEIDTEVLDVLESGEGVCQDFAHLQICCLRSFGIFRPLCERLYRYVSSARPGTLGRRGRFPRTLDQCVFAPSHRLGGFRSRQTA